MSLFEVDRNGLRNQIEKRGRGWIVGELAQNAWDANGVRDVKVTLTPVEGRPLAVLVVEGR
jgi:anti-sigma factor RsiW